MTPPPTPSVTDPALEAAATWLARLQASDRTQADLDGFRDWQRADPANAVAFDKVNSAYEAIGALKNDPAFAERPKTHDRRAVLAGLAGALAIASAAAVLSSGRAMAYETRVGEQRRVTLPDGTRVTLDTSTRLVVDARDLTAKLVRGRAYFETARASDAAFAIEVGDCRIDARGAQLDISRRDHVVLVCVVEGQAQIRRTAHATLLHQGQRLRADTGGWRASAAPQAIDQPDLTALTAWRGGQLVFVGTSLAEAVSEMNRYSDRRIELADASLGRLAISGAYRTGDPVAFVRSVALLLDLKARDEGGRLILVRTNA